MKRQNSKAPSDPSSGFAAPRWTLLAEFVLWAGALAGIAALFLFDVPLCGEGWAALNPTKDFMGQKAKPSPLPELAAALPARLMGRLEAGAPITYDFASGPKSGWLARIDGLLLGNGDLAQRTGIDGTGAARSSTLLLLRGRLRPQAADAASLPAHAQGSVRVCYDHKPLYRLLIPALRADQSDSRKGTP
jgi:hypothetical protein